MKNLLDERPTTTLHGGNAFARSFVEDADLRGRDVLDIGCGFGWFTLIALEGGASSVVGVEPSERDLATARRHLSDPRCSFAVAGADALPFEDESFDTVVLWEVLEHVPPGTEEQAFAEIARVLRPGGSFYLSTPNATPIAKITDPAWWVAGHRHYDADTLRRFVAGAGLEVVRLQRRGGSWQIVHMLNLYVAKWVFRRRPFLETRSLRRLDRDWARGDGFVHLYLHCTKRAQAR